MEEEDPFDAFGDDEDDEGINENDKVIDVEASMKAKYLVDAANARLKENEQPSNPAYGDDGVNDDNDPEDFELPPPSNIDWPQPLYKHPALYLTSSLPVGGGRGLVVTETLNAGTLVLVEAPIMAWPEDQLGKRLGMESVRHIITMIVRTNDTTVLHDMELFHPTKAHVDSLLMSRRDQDHDDKSHSTDKEYEQEQNQVVKMIRQLELMFDPKSIEQGDEDFQFLQQEQQQLQQHANQFAEREDQQRELQEIVDLATAKGILNRDGSNFTKLDVIRLLLALRYNGLESGVYRHVAMLNHEDYPNTAKLMPLDGKNYSEVRTTRKVKKGESLTISYLPRIVSHASRRHYLWNQHRFDIGPVNELSGDQLRVELIGGSMPPSSTTVTNCSEAPKSQLIETACEELEHMLLESRISIHSLSPASLQPDTFDTVKAIEQSALELYESSKTVLKNDEHIILHPILSLHLEACALVLEDPSLSQDPSIRLGVLTRVALSAYRLMSLQKIVRGADHFEVGSVSLDLANATSELLSRSPERLLQLELPLLDTFSAWSKLEQKARQEHRRIKDLYPHDAELKIKPPQN
jgi:hypothetical protein